VLSGVLAKAIVAGAATEGVLELPSETNVDMCHWIFYPFFLPRPSVARVQGSRELRLTYIPKESGTTYLSNKQ
jgi:hypothetical protein